MKITDYDMMAGKTPDELTQLVRSHVSQGWDIVGPCLWTGKLFVQVIVKAAPPAIRVAKAWYPAKDGKPGFWAVPGEAVAMPA